MFKYSARRNTISTIIEFFRWLKRTKKRFMQLSLENVELNVRELFRKISKIRAKMLRRKTWIKAVEMGEMVPGGLRELQVSLFYMYRSTIVYFFYIKL